MSFKLPVSSSRRLEKCGTLPKCRPVKYPHGWLDLGRAGQPPVQSDRVCDCEAPSLTDGTYGDVCTVCGVIQRPYIRAPDAWEEGHKIVRCTTYNCAAYVDKLIRSCGVLLSHREHLAVATAIGLMQKEFFRLYPGRKNFVSYPYVIKRIVCMWRVSGTGGFVTRTVSAVTQRKYDAMVDALVGACRLEKCINMASSPECDHYFSTIPLKRSPPPTKITDSSMSSSSASRKRSRTPAKTSVPLPPPSAVPDVIPLHLSVPPEADAYTGSNRRVSSKGNNTYLNIRDKVFLAELERSPSLFPKTYDPSKSIGDLRKACEEGNDAIDASLILPDTEEMAHALSAWHMFVTGVARDDLPPGAKCEVKEWVSDQGYAKARIDIEMVRKMLAQAKADHGIVTDDIWKLPFGKYKVLLQPVMIWKMPGKAGMQWKIKGIKLIEPYEREQNLLDDADFMMNLL